MGTNTVNDSGLANSISMLFDTFTGFPSNAIVARVNGTQFSLPIYFPLPSGVWQFLALSYDGGTNAMIYYGTEASPAKLMAVNNIGVQTVNFGTSGTLQIGNRLNGRARALPGWLDEFRFYVGTANATSVESIRQSSCPVVISGLTPDGSSLMEGTNMLSFTASSANTIPTNAIKVALNGTDISSSLVFGGTPSAVTVSYTGLPINPTLINNASLNGAILGIQVTDASGIVATNRYTYDTFSPTNFTWETEDYNYSTNAPFSGGGNFIDNPRYAFVSAPDTYWQRASEILDDYDDNGAPAGTLRVYRSALDAVETEFSVGTGNNGGTSVGELMRQKVLDAFALDPAVREVNVGFFDGWNGGGPAKLDGLYENLSDRSFQRLCPGGIRRRHAFTHSRDGHERGRHHDPDHQQPGHLHHSEHRRLGLLCLGAAAGCQWEFGPCRPGWLEHSQVNRRIFWRRQQ